ncbi:MAG: mycothione reductase [Acidimicrobiales bacterium]
MSDLDLLIIGSGSGNSILTPEYEGLRVGMVERWTWGGTCLNRGCIPSKMLVLPADRVVEAEESAQIGIDLGLVGVDWPAIRDRIFGRIDPIAESGRKYRVGQDHVEVFEGDARFTGPKSVRVNGDEISAERFVLAAGARPTIPDIPGLADTPYETSDTVMRIDALPERVVIIGGGFIAAELGHVFSGLGSHVSIVHRGHQMLRHEDVDISQRFTEEFARRVDVHLDANVTRVDHRDGEFTVEIRCPHDCDLKVEPESGGLVTETLRADLLLVTTGRTSNARELGVEAAGVRLDDNGYVITDDYLRTTAPDIWALGDIRNPLQLKHLANAEARVMSHNLLHPYDLRMVDERVVPHAVFSHPQVGSVGVREVDVQASGAPYVVGRYDYAGTAYGWALDDVTSFAKVIVDPQSLQLLGGHVIGPQAATLLQQLVQAMAFEIPVDRLARGQLWTHPGLAEVLENALLDALRKV